MAQVLRLDELRTLARCLEREPRLKRDVWVRLARRQTRGNLLATMIEELALILADVTADSGDGC